MALRLKLEKLVAVSAKNPGRVQTHCSGDTEWQLPLQNFQKKDLYCRPDDGRENSWSFLTKRYDERVDFSTNDI